MNRLISQQNEIGSIIAGRVSEPSELSSLFDSAGVSGQRFVIKVNWFGPEYGYFTDAHTLDFVLNALPPGEKIIIEGHAYGRNDGSREIDWRNLDEVRSNWDWIREQDTWFLESTGLDGVLKKHNASYINITDEIWNGKVVSPGSVKSEVESRFSPVVEKELYSCVPEKLWDLKGTTLISLARIKVRSPGTLKDDPSPYSPIFSLAMKNLFGLVPDPFRFRWHGTGGEKLAQSILDITKIYSSLFDIVGLNEGIFHTLVSHQFGTHKTNWGRYDILDDQGIAVLGRELIELDTFTASMFFPLNWRRWPLFDLAKHDFGNVNEDLLNISLPDFADIADQIKEPHASSETIQKMQT